MRKTIGKTAPMERKTLNSSNLHGNFFSPSFFFRRRCVILVVADEEKKPAIVLYVVLNEMRFTHVRV